MTTILLSLAIVLPWGTWIPVAQIVPGAKQSTRTLYVTTGNLVFAAAALVVDGSAGQLTFGWKAFWLPLAGGLVWTMGSVCAFRATETIGLARAAGTWTPLNIIVAFVFGALLFGELKGFDATHFAILGGCLALVLAGVFLIIASQRSAGAAVTAEALLPAGPEPAPAAALAPATGPVPPAAAPAAADPTATTASAVSPNSQRLGMAFAVGAGLLWGAYFVPAQWAHVPSQLGNFPLALGMFVAAVAFAARDHGIVRLAPRHTAIQLASGLLFGIGSIALLVLVPRIGTGAGFTIAQLSLLVNAGVGIWVFKVPPPGSRAARVALAGILLAGIGGTILGGLR